jgi:1,2-diacylglycerol 3-beta-galactosyltransferase
MPRKKRFLILTSDSGFGHRSAANSIAMALELRHPQEVITSVINPIFEEPSSTLLQKAELNYDKTVRDYPSWWRFAYEVSNHRSVVSFIERTLTLILHKNIQQLIEKMKPDAIISTNQMFNAPAGEVLNSLETEPPFFTVITDLADVHSMWFNVNPDLFFVASDYVKSRAIDFGINPKRIIVSGIPVNPSFSAERLNRTEMRLKLGLDPNLTKLLVVASQRMNGVLDHLEALERVLQPFQVVVIAGGDRKLYEECSRHSWKFPIMVKNFVNNMPEWMHSADALITKAGGLVLSEGLAAGLPIIMVNYIPGQEEGNIRYILENQAGAMAETPGDFYRIMESWLSNEQRLLRGVARNSQRLGRPDAAFVIADAPWQATEVGVTQIAAQSECIILP